jgi:carboxypeptidase C (cathepsin A)
VYAGAHDTATGWLAGDRTTRALVWRGRAQFEAQALREWKVGGAAVGRTWAWQGLRFVKVDGAGHMVCAYCEVGRTDN